VVLVYEPSKNIQMIFLIIATAAILGVFSGKFVYLFTQRKQLIVGSQFNTKDQRVYNSIKK